MRNRWARRVVVGLVLAFPLAISAVASPSPSPTAGRLLRGFSVGTPVVAVEMVLLGGLVFAGRERRRLLVEMDAARTRPREAHTFTPAMVSGTKAPARASLFGHLRR